MRTRHRHYNRGRTTRYWQTRGSDHHHLLFSANSWLLGPYGCLRCHPYCNMIIPNSLHTELHRIVGTIPRPSEDACRAAYNTIKQLAHDNQIDCAADPLDRRLEILANLWRDSSPNTAYALERERYAYLNYVAKNTPTIS